MWRIWMRVKQIVNYINKRITTFSFTLGSIGYGFYHFFNPGILTYSNTYAAVNQIFGLIGGRYFGLIFIVVGCLKLYGLIVDNIYLKLPLYFVLLFLWILLGCCFFIAFLFTNVNPSFIYCFIIAAMSTNIIKMHQQEIVIKGDVDG